LFQPFDVGCLLVREGSLLRRAFEIAPDYLHDAQTDPREVNLADYGFQLSRSARAIKVWLSVSYFGLGRFRRSIDRGIDLAEHAQRRIEASDDLELLSPRSLGIVCFRRTFGGETDEAKLAAWNQRLLVSLEATGRALLSSTRLRGRYALRIVVLGHTTKQEDVDWVLDWIEHVSIDREAPSLAPTPGMNRSPDVEEGWLGRAAFSPDEVRAIPLFAGLRDAWSVELARSARWRSCEPGETVVERWEQSRDFFVVVEGLVEVSGADGVVATIGPGGFFGELAALEWGADFSYSRSATVVALEPTRLAVVPPAVLNRLIGDEPSVAEPVRAALRARLDGA
jgi:hypothetical protein